MSTPLRLITSPDPMLRQISDKIDKIDASVKSLSSDMIKIMHKSNGIGLAAIQVGIKKTLVVIDISMYLEHHEQEIIKTFKDTNVLCTFNNELLNKLKKPLVLVNPVLYNHSQDICSFDEGCLSVPGDTICVKRSSSVSLDYTDLSNKRHTIHATGILARVLLHEYDHLFGKLIVDYLSNQDQEGVMIK